jgi:hypothetical protein
MKDKRRSIEEIGLGSNTKQKQRQLKFSGHYEISEIKNFKSTISLLLLYLQQFWLFYYNNLKVKSTSDSAELAQKYT